MQITKSIPALVIMSAIIIIVLGFLVLYVFPGNIILPQYFFIFGLKIYIYGIILAMAILASYFFARTRLQKYQISTDQFDSLVLVLIITGFIGARLYHILTNFTYYQANFNSILQIWRGGLGIYGAIFGGLIGLLWYQRKYLVDTPFAKLLDFLAPSILIGQIIGRLGNLFNYELYGVPTNLPWKMYVPVPFRVPPYESFLYFHPSFLYEGLVGLLILVFLIKWTDIAKQFGIRVKDGQVFLLWLGLYSMVRIVVEAMRAQASYAFGIKQNFLIAGTLALLCAGLFIKTIYESKKSQNS